MYFNNNFNLFIVYFHSFFLKLFQQFFRKQYQKMMNKTPIYAFYILIISSLVYSFGCQNPKPKANYTPFLKHESLWTDSILSRMTIDDKIQQLLIKKVTGVDSLIFKNLSHSISSQNIGGILFEGLTLEEQRFCTDSLSSIAKIPLWIAMESSDLLNNQLKDTPEFPSVQAVQAADNDTLHQH